MSLNPVIGVVDVSRATGSYEEEKLGIFTYFRNRAKTGRLMVSYLMSLTSNVMQIRYTSEAS